MTRMRILTLVAALVMVGVSAGGIHPVADAAAQVRASDTLKQIPAVSDACTPQQIRSIAAAQGQRLRPNEIATLSRWCADLDKRDRGNAANNPNRIGMPPSEPRTTPITIDRIGTTPPDSAIWCTKTWCTCYQGKHYNGCVHTDKVCASGSVTCGPGGKLCGCKTG